MDFTTEYAGFERSRILRLQENEALSRSDKPGFWDVLSGASPDYSVIAQKAGPTHLMKSIDDPFYADQGLQPETIASRYDHQISHRLAQIDQELATTRSHMEQELTKAEAPTINLENILEQCSLSLQDRIELEKRLAIAESHLLESKANASALLERIERSEQEARHYQKEMALLEMKAIESREALETHQNRIKELTLQCESTQNQAIEWHDQIHRIKGSLSWRMTKPLRGLRTVILWTAGLLKGILEGILLLALAILLVPLSPILIIAVPWILRKPVLRNKIGQRVKHFPPLRRLLKLATRTISPSSVASAAGHEASANSSKNGQKPIQEPNKGPQLEKKSPALGKLSGQIHRRLQQSN
jgi:O-antigen chain-terminating methyltransferase